jgi:hypothetical protein
VKRCLCHRICRPDHSGIEAASETRSLIVTAAELAIRSPRQSLES